MSYLFNLYKYIYYNFCIYKSDDDDTDNEDINCYNIDLNKKVDLDKMIISSLVCNNIEIPFFEIKTFNSQYMNR